MNRLEAIKKVLLDEGYYSIREFPDEICGLHNYLTTTGLVVGLSITSYRGRYCYESQDQAEQAIREWDGHGDPPGPWIKYKGEEGERLGPGAIHEF